MHKYVGTYTLAA